MKLYVGNLGDSGAVTAADLRTLFEKFGTITECECIKNYAFVHITEESGANQAVDELNGYSLNGRPLKVEKSESKGPKKPSQKIFVGNLKEGTTSDELRELFQRFCSVLEADVIKNFGFVHIDANAGRNKMSEILRELNGYELNGNPIRVQPSTSGVRQRPGMGGDQCFKCGKDGHWSRECPNENQDGYEGNFSRGGGPMRGPPGGNGSSRSGSGPYDRPYDRNRGGGGGGGGGSGPFQRNDPYPAPPPPSYMRERMAQDRGGYNQGGGYGSGYSRNDSYTSSGNRGGPMGYSDNINPNNPFTGGSDMYDNRTDSYNRRPMGNPYEGDNSSYNSRDYNDSNVYSNQDPYGQRQASGAGNYSGGAMTGPGGNNSYSYSSGGAGNSFGGYEASSGISDREFNSGPAYSTGGGVGQVAQNQDSSYRRNHPHPSSRPYPSDYVSVNSGHPPQHDNYGARGGSGGGYGMY